MRTLSIVVGIFALVVSSCGPGAVGKGDYEIRGSIVDDKTGEPITRSDVSIQFCNEAIEYWAIPRRVGESTFKVRMALPTVRLRVFDATSRYEFYEKTLEVPRSGVDCQIRLLSVRFITLRGRVFVEEAGSWVPMAPPEPRDYPPPPIRGYPVLSFDWEMRGSGCYCPIDSNGIYEVQLPCKLVEVSAVDGWMRPETEFVDLTGVTAEIVERDIRLIRVPEVIEAPDPEHEARLDPSRYVQLKGRLLVREGETWIPLTPEIADKYGKPEDHLAFGLVCKHDGFWSTRLHPDGSFEVQVPRDRLRMYMVNTELGPVTPVLDLTAVTTDVVERDIHMAKDP
ncbi:MAG TPA: hypothetical protein VK843_21385 [Planctomycetota bacterium]|nr:hypothetical protein [Planctomycetota bacterium]